jgi:hypothetical protein
MIRTTNERVPLLAASLLVALLALAPGDRLAAQAGVTIRGRVTDQAANPIHEARIAVMGGSAVARTAGDGRYVLQVPSTDSMQLQISAIGHETTTRTIHPGTAGTVIENVRLVRAVYTVPEITVTSQAPDELKGIPGSTAIVGTGVLQKRAPISMMDALRPVPGMLTAGSAPASRCCSKAGCGTKTRASARPA